MNKNILQYLCVPQKKGSQQHQFNLDIVIYTLKNKDSKKGSILGSLKNLSGNRFFFFLSVKNTLKI